jgi:hypothetical protein
VELESILFGFYTEEEVKKLSVKKLTKSERLDAKNCPVPGGLLDPAMGPLNANDTYASLLLEFFSAASIIYIFSCYENHRYEL